MLCNNCGKREANIKYTETINGETRKLNLCEECSKKLGIGQIDFNMPFDFTGFFDDFMEEFRMPELIPMMGEFENPGIMPIIEELRIKPIRENMGNNTQNTRSREKIGKTIDEKINNRNAKKENSKKNQKKILQEKLEKAIKEERYEDAAKIRDEITKIN